MKALIISFMFLSACGQDFNERIIYTPGTTTIAYMGCYTDTSVRALSVNLLWTGATVEACVDIAKAQGFKYAGVQYGTQCFAGNVPGYTKVSDNNCNMPCSADPSEICGGTWLNSIYSTGN